MKRKLAVLGLVLLSAVAVSTQTPGPVAASLICGPVQQTALHTVGGSTCLQARNDLLGVLINASGCYSGFCSQQFIYQPCLVIQGGYSVSGYLRYSCSAPEA